MGDSANVLDTLQHGNNQDQRPAQESPGQLAVGHELVDRGSQDGSSGVVHHVSTNARRHLVTTFQRIRNWLQYYSKPQWVQWHIAKSADAQKAGKRAPHPLVEPGALALAVTACGTISTFMSERLEADRHVVQAFELLRTAVKHNIHEQQMAARPAAGTANARQRGAATSTERSGQSLLRASRQKAPSSQLLTAVRQLFKGHLFPLLKANKIAKGTLCKNYTSCFVNTATGPCAAGGNCVAARQQLGWPLQLALVNPNRTTPSSA